MPWVGNLIIKTNVTVGQPGSRTTTTTVGPNSASPTHVIEIRNPTSLTYAVKVFGQVIGNPRKVDFFGGKPSWSSPVLMVLGRRSQSPEEPIKRNGQSGAEDLACSEVIEQSS